jgi:hypothetical protein
MWRPGSGYRQPTQVDCSNEMSVMIKKTMWILAAVTVLAFVLATTVRADERKQQSAHLARASNAVVPAIATDVTSLSLADLQTVTIVAVTPDDTDAAITGVIQSRALPNAAACVSAPGTAGVFRPVPKVGHPTHQGPPARYP